MNISPAGGLLLAIPQAVPMAGVASVHLNRGLLVYSHKEAAVKGILGPASRGRQPGPPEAQAKWTLIHAVSTSQPPGLSLEESSAYLTPDMPDKHPDIHTLELPLRQPLCVLIW